MSTKIRTAAFLKMEANVQTVNKKGAAQKIIQQYTTYKIHQRN